MIWLIWIAVPYMLVMSRSSGGQPHLPFGLSQWLLCAPFLLFYPWLSWWVLLAYIFGVAGARLGHGRGTHYDEPFEPGSSPERVEAFIPQNWPVYWQKFSIMFLTGVVVTLCIGLCLILHGYIASGIVLLVSGALKAVAYMTKKTEPSEYLRGAFLGLGVAIAYMVMV